MAKKVEKKIVKENKEEDKKYFGIISYILGIVAIVQAFVSPVSGILLSIVGLVFSNKESSELSKKGKKFNIIALIIGFIIFFLSIFLSLKVLQGEMLY